MWYAEITNLRTYYVTCIDIIIIKSTINKTIELINQQIV